MWKIPRPRLLPATIATLAALLAVKCGVLLEAAVLHGGKPDVVMVAVANAASTERAPEGAPTRASERDKSAAGKAAGGAPTTAGDQKPSASPPAPDAPPAGQRQ